MNSVSFVYPPTPTGVDEEIIKPSSAFKIEVIKVAGAIVFFVFVYLILVAAACGIAALCAFGGVMLVVSFPKFITLMIGLGLLGSGLMVIYFLIKFIFKRNKVDRSGLIEVTEAEEPQLFAFIKTLTSEVQTSLPKRIYLSPDVNACVFYDSSFWSMFFPVKKNLQIGLGLVNSVNISEFKAILAHEFGHFSQHSMKLGNYVYNVNQIIYNMLADNDSYGKTLDTWANISGYFTFFAAITIRIVQSIQWVLQKVYVVINKSYMSLSRQMEFHADSVAAFVTGSDHLITSLRRLEAADLCYNQLFNRYNEWFGENLKADNLYAHHKEMMKHFATDFNIPIVHGLPQVNAQSFVNFNQSKIIIKDQWASHPSTDDREEYLKSLNIKTEPLHDSAWIIFSNADALQKGMTEKIYEGTKFKESPGMLDVQLFQEKFLKEIEDGSFHKDYRGFYDSWDIKEFDVDLAVKEILTEDSCTFTDLVNESTCNLPKTLNNIQADLNTVNWVMNKDSGIKTFDFEGQKYSKKNAPEIVSLLEAELNQVQKQLENLDKKMFGFFYNKALKTGMADELKQAYKNLFKVKKESEQDIESYREIMEELNPIYAQNLSFDDANSIINKVKIKERIIKDRIRTILTDASYTPYLEDKYKTSLDKFLVQDKSYLGEESFDNEALAILTEGVGAYVYIVSERNFKTKKKLLEWQLQLLNPEVTEGSELKHLK